MTITRQTTLRQSFEVLPTRPSVIVVDIDEFVYHPFLIDLLRDYKASGVTLPKIKGYNMVSERFPEGHEAILRAVRHGVPDDVDMDGYLNAYGKRCVFHPSIDINCDPGCHECSPQGEVRESETAEIKLLHYKYLGLDYTLKRFAVIPAKTVGGEYQARLGVPV